jgi:monoamine oxidase
VLEQLAQAFGDEARRPAHYHEQDWSTERFTRGCPVALPEPGALSQLGPALRAPCGRVHWAGTETATESPGYLEGAIEAGERAASEIRARL